MTHTVTRTSLPDTVTARSSSLDNPRHVLSCWTFVLSHRSTGLFSGDQLVVGELDSSSLHRRGSVSCMKHYLWLERVGRIESFRRLWVFCKSNFYWDFSQHEIRDTPFFCFFVRFFCTCALFTGTIKNTVFLSLVPFTTCHVTLFLSCCVALILKEGGST